MNRPSNRSLLAIVLFLCVLPLACSSGPTGPEVAVQEFYGHLNEGAYSSAMALYSSESRGIFADPDTGGTSMFDEWARSETKDGKIDRVEFLQQETSDDSANVEFEIVYNDGSRIARSVTLTRENGDWKLGLIR